MSRLEEADLYVKEIFVDGGRILETAQTGTARKSTPDPEKIQSCDHGGSQQLFHRRTGS